MSRLALAFHNIVIHPICGVLYLVGATRLGNWLHDLGRASNDG